MNSRHYLFYGFNGEYVLNPLYNEMVKRGYNCLEIDTAKEQDIKGRLDTLKGKKVVFITCAHVFFDENNLRDICPGYPKSISALEVIDYLKPIKKYYYPHDLMDGFTHKDKDWFSLFDVYLSPLECNSHGERFCKVIDVGWIKKNKYMSKRCNQGNDIVINHAIGGFSEYYYLDLENMYKVFKPLWDLGIKVKLPNNIKDRKKYEDFFYDKNVELYNDNANIYDLIDESDIVITNEVTAVSIEAALSGRKVINIFDEIGRIPYDYQTKLVKGYPNLDIMTVADSVKYIQTLRQDNILIESKYDYMKPFNMDLSIDIITSD